ncbi:tRNA pseudouridine(38/39) synthase isoform X2 [Channa argus]|uniref:tRNA pseudouridine(38/39) synthase isoform X2 n=1 Tax=Channa argus TaxID=215402 RepID=UPI00351FBCEB
MSETLVQRIKELEGELEKLRSQLKERRAAGEDTETMSSPSPTEDTDCKPHGNISSSKKSKKASKERPFDFSVHPRRHVALRLAYLGWAYQGFAVQENTDNTVESRLFEALLKTRLIQDRQTSNYHRCGRTDKGVSAFSQVITIDLRSTQFCGGLGVTLPENVDISTKKKASVSELPYVKMLNRVLPQDIRILDWAPVAEGFSARFDCQSRTYRYYFPRGSLDVALMAEAAKSMAVDYPLVLYDCHFEGLSWKQDAEEVNHVFSALQQHWTQSAVKTHVLHGMSQGLLTMGGGPANHCWLVEGSRRRNYRPLLERPCCESLESRIDHFVKRGRLEREEAENGGEVVHRGKRSKHSHNFFSSETPSKQSTDQKADD